MPDPVEPLRERVVAELTTRLTALTAEGPYGIEFSEVHREPLGDDIPVGKKAVAAVLDVEETKNERTGVVDCFCTVFIEMHVFRDKNIVGSTLINRHLGAVDKMLRADRTLGGLSRNIRITGSESSPEGPYKNYASGVLRVVLEYRHTELDPTERI